jgi:hypothetical protein
LYDENGIIIDKKYNDMIDELKNRFHHLSRKTEILFDSDKQILFVMKARHDPSWDDISYIEKIYNTLLERCNKNFRLLIVTEEDHYKEYIEKFRDDIYMYIRKVKQFATISNASSTGDIEGWKNVFLEFKKR